MAASRLVLFPTPVPRQASLVFGCVLAGVLLSGLGVLQLQGDPAQYLQTAALAVFFAALPWVFGLLTPHTHAAVRSLARVHVIVGLVVALYGVYQVLARLADLPLASLDLNNPTTGEMRTTVFFGYPRPSSVFTEPSWFGTYLVDLSILSLVLSIRMASPSKFLRIGRYLFPTVLLITMSVGAYLNLFLTLLVLGGLGWLGWRSVGQLIATVLIALSAAFLVSNHLGQQFGINVMEIALQRVGPLVGFAFGFTGEGSLASGESVGTRLESIQMALDFFMTAPLFGIGVGNFAAASAAIGSDRLYVDSAWLAVLSEQGLVGLTAWLLMFWLLLRPRRVSPEMEPYFNAYRAVVLARALGMINLGGLWDFWIFLPISILVVIIAQRPRTVAFRT